MPAVQKAVLTILPKLAPTHLPQVGNCASVGAYKAVPLECLLLHCSGRTSLQTLCSLLPSLQMWPEYIYSIVRLLRPEHVIEQWQEREAAERGAAARTAAGVSAARQSQSSPADQPASASVDASAALQAGSTGVVEPTNGGSGNLMWAISGTMKQPPGQLAQFKFALTSAFLEQVLAWWENKADVYGAL